MFRLFKMRWREKFSGISTERLEKWLSNVEFIKKEYEDGTHDANNCRHCNESSGNSISRICHRCIWQTMTGVTCINYIDKNCSSFHSANVTHKKSMHIARCTKWIAILQKELNRRNKKCS